MFVVRTALKDIRRRLRDPVAFAMWIGFPLALGTMVTFAFGGLSRGEVPTAEIWVVDEDESALSAILVNALSAGGEVGFPVVAREVEPAEGRSLIDKGRGSALLIIPADFGGDVLDRRPTSLQLVTNPAQLILPRMVEESLRLLVDAIFYLQQTLGEPISRIVDAADSTDGFLDNSEVAEISILINEAMIRMDSMLFPPVIELEVVRPEQRDDSEATDAANGFVVLFLPSMLFMALFFMAFGISEDVWVEKQQGTLRRALATPNASAQFLAGKLLAAAAMMATVVFSALVAARLLLGAQIQNIVLAGLWATLAGALFLAPLYVMHLYASSQRAGGILSSIVMLPLLMLGGSFFPFEVMPEALVRIGRFTPNGWALVELRTIVENNFVWGRLGLSTAVVLLAGMLLFAAANRRMAGVFARS